MALKLKKIGGISFLCSLIVAFFIENLRNQPLMSIIMVLSLIVCALGFYIERRNKWIIRKYFIKMEKFI